MSVRAIFAALLFSACSCGASEVPVASSTESPVTELPGAPSTGPASETPSGDEPTPTGVDRCEGLVGGCGAWIGCVMVRVDPTTPGGFVGVGPDAGHLYVENHDCHGGICNEVCTGGSLSMCRPGLNERDLNAVCSAAVAPSHAPFTCRIEAGACVQGPDPAMIPAS